jgi:hypothetical protein
LLLTDAVDKVGGQDRLGCREAELR